MSPDQLLLDASGVTVRYGETVANDGVDIKVHAGEVTGLIGPNGAGKTTFVDAVSGFTRCSGSIRLEEQALERSGPHRRRTAGLARTWQAGELFVDLTVEQNLTVAVNRPGFRSMVTDVFRRKQPRNESVDRTVELLGLQDVLDRSPAELPLGRQRLVGVGRALVGETKVVLLDEPAAGLDTHESAVFGEDVRRIAAAGIGVLLIDHDMSLVLTVCDRLYVMDFGKIIASGTPAEIQEDPRVIAAYLGAVDHEAMVDD